MKMLHFQSFIFFLSCSLLVKLNAQDIMVNAYVYEAFNRGYVKAAAVEITDSLTKELVATGITNENGFFSTSLTEGRKYQMSLTKPDMENLLIRFVATDEKEHKQFLKLEMKRSPGYIFDVTLADEDMNAQNAKDGITGALIEIYNRTLAKEELVITESASPNFQFTLKNGNHYTMLIRKEGYLSKRIEAYVNVKGCVLCLDGISDLTPGVADNISSTGLGTLLANIELQKASVGKSFEIKNINYDYNKWEIRPDAAKILDNVVYIFNDNPGLELEMGSHTDARGNDDYNLELSNNRARAAMNYLLMKGIDSTRISYKGYGETLIKNRCKNLVSCSDKEHEENRRTELKITGVRKKESDSWVPLSRMIREEEFQKEMFQSVPPVNKNAPKTKSKGPNADLEIQIQEGSLTSVPFNQAAEQDTAILDSSKMNVYYFVIAGSFLVPSHADKQIKKLLKLGYGNSIRMIIADSEFHSVVVDQFEVEIKAKKVLSSLKSKGIDAFIKKVKL
ncbi:MAG TPA: OmpA family protein [Saprospiraceae bacterium]|nr:OmpA family protein [Saprospiraceae bacterium]